MVEMVGVAEGFLHRSRDVHYVGEDTRVQPSLVKDACPGSRVVGHPGRVWPQAGGDIGVGLGFQGLVLWADGFTVGVGVGTVEAGGGDTAPDTKMR